MRALAVSLVLLLAACAAEEPGTPTAEDRQAAEPFAAGSIAASFPDYPASAAAEVADCVAENATGEELMILAGKAKTVNEKSRRTLAIAIANRPAAEACLRGNDLPPLR
ncbi:hypothetical protein [Mangrovicoccus sp. HB161399]|uniref:hypothetical protein n=1 Tax=Mangrovicoccus sp. HB161399 TaxID=2720392 RepID=UPI0015522F58|nr:hypothetical protein [Mangrovicoccus sp. HB161399]